MTCPKCGTPIPADKIGCPACMEKLSREEALRTHRDAMPFVLQGTYWLKLIQMPGGMWHIAGVRDPHWAWCDEPTYTTGPKSIRRLGKQIRVQYRELEKRAQLCQKCYELIQQLAKETTTEVA